MRLFWLLLVVAVLSGGCGNQYEKVASETQLSYQGPRALLPHEEAETLLTIAFSTTEWEMDDKYTAVSSRGAITLMFEFMETKLTMDAKLPYYVLRNGFDFIKWLYHQKLQPILDKKSMNGELTKEASMIYYYVSRDIETNLKLISNQLRKAEEDIAADATQADIDMLISAYDTIKPLIAFL